MRSTRDDVAALQRRARRRRDASGRASRASIWPGRRSARRPARRYLRDNIKCTISATTSAPASELFYRYAAEAGASRTPSRLRSTEPDGRSRTERRSDRRTAFAPGRACPATRRCELYRHAPTSLLGQLADARPRAQASGRRRHLHHRPQRQLHERLRREVQLLRVLPAGRIAARATCSASTSCSARSTRRSRVGGVQLLLQGGHNPGPAADVVRGSVPRGQGSAIRRSSCTRCRRRK